jgi:hypothetical protein
MSWMKLAADRLHVCGCSWTATTGRSLTMDALPLLMALDFMRNPSIAHPVALRSSRRRMPDGMSSCLWRRARAGLVGLAGLAPGMCWLQTIQLLWTRAIAERGHIDQADDLQDQVGRRNGVPTGLPAPTKPSCPRRQGGTTP